MTTSQPSNAFSKAANLIFIIATTVAPCHDYAALSFGLGAPKAGEFGLVKVNGESVIALAIRSWLKPPSLKLKVHTI